MRGNTEKKKKGTLFKPGHAFIVKAVDYDNEAGKQLIDMGITPDTLIYIDRAAPLGEPLVVRVGDYKVALRSKDLSALEVESADELDSHMTKLAEAV